MPVSVAAGSGSAPGVEGALQDTPGFVVELIGSWVEGAAAVPAAVVGATVAGWVADVMEG